MSCARQPDEVEQPVDAATVEVCGAGHDAKVVAAAASRVEAGRFQQRPDVAARRLERPVPVAVDECRT
jgi:hypothetical protein